MKLSVSLLALGLVAFNAFGADRAGQFIRQTESDYAVTPEMIKEMADIGTSFYSVNLMTKEELMKPERAAFVELDYMGQYKLENNHYLVSKHVYMLNRTADFFSCGLLGNIKYVRALEKESVTRTGDMTYLMKGDKFMVYKYQFDLNWFADLPDCQNIASSGTQEMNEDLEKLKAMDPAVDLPLHGAYLKDKPNFTKFLTSGWIFAKIHRVPHVDGEKTLLITYEVTAMPSQFAIKNIVENGHIQVMELEEKANSEFKPERVEKD